MAVQYDMAVEDGAGGIGNRILRVVAFRQHGVEGSNRTAAGCTVTGTFDELRQPREDAGWITTRDPQFAPIAKAISRCAIGVASVGEYS